jgi:hypothetical protein
MTQPRYGLNKNDGIDTLHLNARESCNGDDAVGWETIDAGTAKSLLDGGFVRRCQHCDLKDAPKDEAHL